MTWPEWPVYNPENKTERSLESFRDWLALACFRLGDVSAISSPNTVRLSCPRRSPYIIKPLASSFKEQPSSTLFLDILPQVTRPETWAREQRDMQRKVPRGHNHMQVCSLDHQATRMMQLERILYKHPSSALPQTSKRSGYALQSLIRTMWCPPTSESECL